MSETLTYDPGTDTVTTEDTLTPEEQDSLQVGEQMQNQQEQLLAGKYKNAEDLEQAYINLQKKLGDQPEQGEDTQESSPEDKAEKEPIESAFLDQLWDEANSEYKEETLEKLRSMDPTDLANQYLDYRKNNASPATRDLSDQEVTELKGVVGGDANYTNMMEWAQTNLQDQEIKMFDAVMERGDPLSAFFAVRSLAYRYQDAVGYEGQMLSGKSAPVVNGFRSQQELVAAMNDPRYDNDPAYRQDVIKKLDRSGNLNFTDTI